MVGEPMAETMKYVLLAAYVALTYYLSYRGMKKTRSLKSFSIGNRDMNPVLIGVTMAASIASTATFVINPGFVYADGLAAYLHYGVGASLGILCALVLLCKGFRRTGAQYQALTIPHWVYCRFGSRSLSLFFAIANLLSITFVVLILVGCAILCAVLFGISQKLALILILAFVFSYVFMGGTYAHAYTNMFQGIMMIFISLFLFGSGVEVFEGGFIARLSEVSSHYGSVFNPGSALYYDFFSVFVSSFLVTAALMMQPHILTKVLYLKDDKDVSRFLLTAIVVGVVFSLMLFIGFFARLKGMEVPHQDQVVAVYINQTFGGSAAGTVVLSIITMALLAAGMSTLDGILVALSAMVVNDLYFPLVGQARTMEQGLKLSRITLVVIALLAFALAWDPPVLVGIFAQQGVYGLAAASVVPITLGVLIQRPIPAWIMGTSAAFGLGGHFFLNLVIGLKNPSVSAAWAILASFGVALALVQLYVRDQSDQVLSTEVET